jgi:hypothetical protein
MQLQHFETKTKFHFCYGILTCIFVIQEERSCMELVYQLLQYFKMQEVCQAKFMTGKDDTVWPAENWGIKAPVAGIFGAMGFKKTYFRSNYSY